MADEYALFEPLSQQDVTDLLRTHEVGRVDWNSTEAAFQLDEFDVETAIGRSVLVRAVSSRVTEPDEIADWPAACRHRGRQARRGW